MPRESGMPTPRDAGMRECTLIRGREPIHVISISAMRALLQYADSLLALWRGNVALDLLAEAGCSAERRLNFLYAIISNNAHASRYFDAMNSFCAALPLPSLLAQHRPRIADARCQGHGADSRARSRQDITMIA